MLTAISVLFCSSPLSGIGQPLLYPTKFSPLSIDFKNSVLLSDCLIAYIILVLFGCSSNSKMSPNNKVSKLFSKIFNLYNPSEPQMYVLGLL